MDSKSLKRYYKEITAYLICDDGTRRRFMTDFKNDVSAYLEEHREADMDELRTVFGEPEAIARGFLDNADIRQIKKKMNFTKVVLIGAISIVLIWAVGITIAIIDGHKNVQGYGIVTLDDENGNTEYTGEREYYDEGE